MTSQISRRVAALEQRQGAAGRLPGMYADAAARFDRAFARLIAFSADEIAREGLAAAVARCDTPIAKLAMLTLAGPADVPALSPRAFLDDFESWTTAANAVLAELMSRDSDGGRVENG